MIPRRPILRRAAYGIAPKSQRILLLDPDCKAAEIMGAQLRHAGFETHITTSCSSALLAIEKMRFDAIVAVADLSIAQLFSDLVTVRNAASGSWFLVIADPTPNQARDLAHQLGADAFFAVPFTVSSLIRRLSALATQNHPPL